MSKRNTIQRVPRASVSLANLGEDLGASLWTGQALDDHTASMIRQVVKDFTDKVMAQNMLTVAHMMQTTPDALRALRNVEDVIYDYRWIEKTCVDPKMAMEMYKVIQESVFKRVKMSTEFCQVLNMSMDRGQDPTKHLHLHYHGPVDEVSIPVDIVEDQNKRRGLTATMSLVKSMIYGEPPAPRHKSRILDADDPDAQPIPLDE